MFTRSSSRGRFSHRTHAHILDFTAEALLVTVRWQTLLFFFFFLGTPAALWHVFYQSCSALAPFTKHHAAFDLPCTACVCVRESLCRSCWSTQLRAGFPDLVKKQQSFNSLSSAGLKTCCWLSLATPTLAGKKKNKKLLLLFLDVFFADPPPPPPPLSFFLSFVSDTAHSCRITGFNRLLLCSVAFQILRPAPGMLPDADRRIWFPNTAETFWK